MTSIEQGFKKAKNLTIQEVWIPKTIQIRKQNISYGNNAQPKQRASYRENKSHWGSSTIIAV